jgi:hypothetical protein
MTIKNFLTISNFSEKVEYEKIKLLAFFQLHVEKQETFNLNELGEKLSNLGYGNPNVSRLKKKLLSSRDFLRADENNFRLHSKTSKELESLFPQILEKDEEIITDNHILPESLYKGTRGYIEKLSVQINASFDNNIFDGCAILMRRLLEVLLVLTYDKLGRLSEIEENGGYKNLVNIIDHTLSNKVVVFPKEVQEVLHDFRVLGNFSAHKIEYNCKKTEITHVKMKYRLAIEVLLYKSGIKI